MALENARSLYANTGGNMRRVLDAVQMPNLKIIWDPANAFVAGEDPAAGYQQVKGHIVDIHCKDAVVLDEGTGLTAWARIGAGGTDWHAHLTLLQNEPVDTYTVETHWQGQRAGQGGQHAPNICQSERPYRRPAIGLRTKERAESARREPTSSAPSRFLFLPQNLLRALLPSLLRRPNREISGQRLCQPLFVKAATRMPQIR